MPRNTNSYDYLADSMNAVIVEDSFQRIFQPPALMKKEASVKRHLNVFEELVEASDILESVALTKSAAKMLEIADMLLSEAQMLDKKPITQEVKPYEGKGERLPAGHEKPAPGEKIETQKAERMLDDDGRMHVAPGEDKPVIMPAGSEEPAPNEKPETVPAEPMNTQNKEEKALEALQDLIDMQKKEPSDV